jgi:putative ABC transport system permease protein
VLLVNTAFARLFFGADDPVGHRVRVLLADESSWRTIIGVVGDVRSAHLEDGPAPTMYAPLAQEPRGTTLLIRTSGEPALAGRMVNQAVAAIDPNQGVSHVRPFTDLIADATSPSRYRASVVSLFAILALVLAAVGVYGVVSSVVVQRTAEWGIRLALGADPRRLLVAVMGRQLAQVMVGVTAGVLGCVALGRVLSRFTFEISSLDPISLAVAATTVLLVATLASYLPARRATRVDPMVALRHE